MLRTVLLLVSIMLAAPPALAQSAFSAAAFVNDQIITQYDLEQRERILKIAGVPNNSELRAAAMRHLIDEKLKRGAAKRAGVAAPSGALNQAMETFARSLRISADQLQARLKSAGVSPGALRDFLEGDVVWGLLIRQRYGSRANVTDEDVEEEIQRSGLTEKVTYNLAELSMPDGPDPAATRARARKIVADIRAGASFTDMVRQHSRSPSRDKGGSVGWVPADRLPPDIAPALAALEIGGVTDPINVRGGVAILTVLDKRVEEVTLTGETRDAVRRRIEFQRLEGYARDYLEELRGAAYIEEK